MADMTLTPTAPLSGYDQTTGDLRLRELTDRALVSLAIPQGGEAALAKAIKSAFKLDLPTPGTSTTSKTHRLIRTAPDQLLFACPLHGKAETDPVRVGKVVYVLVGGVLIAVEA